MSPQTVDTLWMLAMTALMVLLPMGLILVERAVCGAASAAGGAPRVVLDLAIALLATWVFGYAWVHGPSLAGLFGLRPGPVVLAQDHAALQASLVLWHALAIGCAVAIAGTAGAVRARPIASAMMALLLAGVVAPLVAHWVWGGRPEGVTVGWLGRLGLMDHGGAVVVHVVAGAASLALAAVLGPRVGRFDGDGRPQVRFAPAPWLEALGGVVLVGGCLGLIGGARLGWRAELPAGLSAGVAGAAAGTVAAAVVQTLRTGSWSARDLRLGSVAGVVSVSAGAMVGSTSWAMLTGVVGAVLALWADRWLVRTHIDDPLGVVAVHLVGGAWAALAAAGALGLQAGLLGRLAVQGTGVVAAAGVSFGTVYLVLAAVDRVMPLRDTAPDTAPDTSPAGSPAVSQGAVSQGARSTTQAL